MSRLTIEFVLSNPSCRDDLLHEFALHKGIVARPSDRTPTALLIDLDDSPQAIWEVRATVGMFDDRAVEIADLVADDQA